MSGETDWKFNLLSGAATVHKGSFLLLRRSCRESFLPDVWGIPAGQVHRGEDPRTACVRELHEETGLSGRVVELMGYSRFTSRRSAIELENIQLNFLVEVPAGYVQLDPTSHSDYKWISLDDVDSNLLDDFTRTIMASARRLWSEDPEPADSRQ